MTDSGASLAVQTGNHSVVVAVIDTGIYPHPAVAANLLGGRDFIPTGGWGDDPAETGNPADFYDRHGHGTRVLTREGSGSSAWTAAAIGSRPTTG